VVTYDGKWQGSGNDKTDCEVLQAHLSKVLFSRVSFLRMRQEAVVTRNCKLHNMSDEAVVVAQTRSIRSPL
jgi:hypothetical protein